MKIYSARQAIFNRQQKVVAYELLFRNSLENRFPLVEPNRATPTLLVQHHLTHGLHRLTQGKMALINFTQANLLDGLPEILDPKHVVVEIVEDTMYSDEVYQQCLKLRKLGYKLALDDFSYSEAWERFIKLCALIKVDIQRTPLNSLGEWFSRLKAQGKVKLLAERVETHEEYQQAKAMGFDYFQGYFFCKPEMQQHREILPKNVLVTGLLSEAMRDEININRIVNYFERDTALAFKLLRFVNSGHLPIVEDIRSIRQAVVYIGNQQLRRLVFLLASVLSVQHKPQELIGLSVHRARFCELLSQHFPQSKEAAFICGLFSLIDAILDQPLEDILAQLPLEQKIVRALLEYETTELSNMLNVVRCYERGEWFKTERFARQLHLTYAQVDECNLQALKWREEFQQVYQ